MAEKGDSTRQVVLGLLAKEPDTVSGVQGRIKTQFRSWRFSPSLAHVAARRLSEEGLVRVVEGDEERPVSRLCLTEDGLAAFSEWLHAPSSGAPPLRNPTRMRLRLCRNLEDLEKRIRELPSEIEACQEAQKDAEARLEKAQRRVELRGHERNWCAVRDCLLLADEVAEWANHEKELYKLYSDFQDLLTDFTPSDES